MDKFEMETVMADDFSFDELAHSFFGCNVGNVHAPVWTCGLEYGGGFDSDFPIPLIDIYPHDFLNCQTWAAGDFYNSFWALESAFCQNVVKLLSVLHTPDPNPSKACWSGPWLDLITATADDGFWMTMNAFPISFANRNVASREWENLKVRFNDGKVGPLTEWSGQESFESYRKEVIKQRRELYRAAIVEFKPKLILAFSKKSDELRCLFDDDEAPEMEWDQWGAAFSSETGNNEKDGTNDCFVKAVSCGTGQTLLAVLPFPAGRYGIASTDKILNVGEELAKHCEEKYGKDWRTSSYPSERNSPYCNKDSDTLKKFQKAQELAEYWAKTVRRLSKALVYAENLREATQRLGYIYCPESVIKVEDDHDAGCYENERSEYWVNNVEKLRWVPAATENLNEYEQALRDLYRHAAEQLLEARRKIFELDRQLYRETFGEEFPAL